MRLWGVRRKGGEVTGDVREQPLPKASCHQEQGYRDGQQNDSAAGLDTLYELIGAVAHELRKLDACENFLDRRDDSPDPRSEEPYAPKEQRRVPHAELDSRIRSHRDGVRLDVLNRPPPLAG